MRRPIRIVLVVVLVLVLEKIESFEDDDEDDVDESLTIPRARTAAFTPPHCPL